VVLAAIVGRFDDNCLLDNGAMNNEGGGEGGKALGEERGEGLVVSKHGSKGETWVVRR